MRVIGVYSTYNKDKIKLDYKNNNKAILDEKIIKSEEDLQLILNQIEKELNKEKITERICECINGYDDIFSEDNIEIIRYITKILSMDNLHRGKLMEVLKGVEQYFEKDRWTDLGNLSQKTRTLLDESDKNKTIEISSHIKNLLDKDLQKDLKNIFAGFDKNFFGQIVNSETTKKEFLVKLIYGENLE